MSNYRSRDMGAHSFLTEARKSSVPPVNQDTTRAVNQARDKGTSSWLNALPILRQ